MFTNHVDPETKIIGIIGHPVKHTISPLIHNFSFELLKLNYIYLPFDIPRSNLKAAIKGIISLGIKGFNVTIPHKENILQHLHNVSEEAAIIGSVNTIVNESGILTGYNTDAFGITETLMPHKDSISGTEISVIGAGGAARSVIYSLIRYFKPGKINIINRHEQKAESLKEYFKTKMIFDSIKSYELFPPDLIDVFNRSKMIINTTPSGMYPDVDDTPVAISDVFNENQIVVDIIYNPVKTKFMSIAESKGAEIVDGLTMLIQQGAKSFELWTGEKMPVEKVLEKVKSELKRNK